MGRSKESEGAKLLRKQLNHMDFLSFIKGKRIPPLKARQKFNNLLVRMYEEGSFPKLEDFPTKMMTE